MRDRWVPQSKIRFSNRLSRLRDKRIALTRDVRKKRSSRSRLTKNQRESVLKKTNSRCHICGGKLKKGQWQADHIHSYSKGGEHSEDNYLAAHAICNNYRWHYSPDEFQEIMKLGIWVRTQIINQTDIGMDVAEKFIKYEAQRIRRRKS